MESMKQRLVMVMTFTFLALTLASSPQPSVVVAAIAAATLCAVLCARISVAAPRHEITIGRRARAHREACTAMPEPQHPDTAGRPRTRAPARMLPAA